MLGIPHVIIQFNMYENLKKNYISKNNTNNEEIPIKDIFVISIISKGIFNLQK